MHLLYENRIFAPVVLLLAFVFVRSSQIPEVKKLDEVEALRKTTGGVVLLLDVGGVAKRLTNDLIKAQSALKEFNVVVYRYDCTKFKDIKCPSKTTIRVMSKEQSEDFYAEYIGGVSAIVAHTLTFILGEEVFYCQDEEDWHALLTSSRGYRDIILLFVEGLGTKEHRYFIEVAFAFSSKYQFAISTVRDHKALKGLKSMVDHGVWYYHCQEVTDPNIECRYAKMESKLSGVLDIIKFVLGEKFPKISRVNEDGTTAFDKELQISIPINIAYLIGEDTEQEMLTKMAEKLLGEIKQPVHFVIVNVLLHENLIRRLGLVETETVPTMIVELKNIANSETSYIEHLFLDLSFDHEHALEYLSSLLRNPKKYFESQAYHFEPIIISPDTVREGNNVSLVGSCANVEPCKQFVINFKRLTRTLMYAGIGNIDIVYIDFTARISELDTKIPSVQLFNGSNLVKEMTEKPTYLNLLKFVKVNARIEELSPMPPSGFDFVPLSLSRKSTKHDSKGDEDETADQEEEEIEDDSDQELFQKEEDEVSKHMIETRRKTPFYTLKNEEGVLALTDKTYSQVLGNFSIAVIHFYLPWEPMSFAFHEMYGKAARSIAMDSDFKEKSTVIANVNCHDWPGVCAAANVTTYPVIKVYRNGIEVAKYRGILGTQEILKAIRLYQAPFLTRLQFESDIVRFSEGKQPMPTSAFCDVLILGLFDSEQSKEFEAFSSVAMAFYGKHLFGYSIGDAARARAKHLDVQVPCVIVFRRNDPYKPHDNFTSFSAAELQHFINMAAINSFAELTISNFPVYHSLGKPYLILFKWKDDDTPLLNSIQSLAKTDLTSKLFLTWMDMENNVTQLIKESYVNSEPTPAIVIVDHKQGAFYRFVNNGKQSLSEWVEQYVKGELGPKGYLNKGKWTPLQEGYDYLALKMRPRENEEETEDSDHDDDSQHDTQQHGRKGGRFAQFKRVSESDSRHSHDEL